MPSTASQAASALELTLTSKGCSTKASRSKTVLLSISADTTIPERHVKKSDKKSISAVSNESDHVNHGHSHTGGLCNLFEGLRLKEDNKATNSSQSIEDVDSSSTRHNRLTSSHCQGRTKSGRMCKNKVRGESYCHLHRTTNIEVVPKFFLAWDNRLVEFSAYIGDYLQDKTKNDLRLEMESPLSESDALGYIYTLEYPVPTKPNLVMLKVGRAVDPVGRISAWGRCGRTSDDDALTPVWKGCYPGKVEPDRRGLFGGRWHKDERGVFCHRAERLVHLELRDVSHGGYYLREGWPLVERPVQAAENTVLKRELEDESAKCTYCGKQHREFFYFQIKNGRKDAVFQLVAAIIKKWSRFVEKYGPN